MSHSYKVESTKHKAQSTRRIAIVFCNRCRTVGCLCRMLGIFFLCVVLNFEFVRIVMTIVQFNNRFRTVRNFTWKVIWKKIMKLKNKNDGKNMLWSVHPLHQIYIVSTSFIGFVKWFCHLQLCLFVESKRMSLHNPTSTLIIIIMMNGNAKQNACSMLAGLQPVICSIIIFSQWLKFRTFDNIGYGG